MEEEKKKRKPKYETLEQGEEKPLSQTSSKVENKKAYKVVLVTLANVVIEVGERCNSVTPNIWGMNLKPGDEIYL
jgi:hypothetical protein